MKFGEPAFFRFQFGFWLVAGAALLLSGLSQMQSDAALVRNLYLTVAGFLASFFLGFMYERFATRRSWALLLPAAAASLVTGFLCTLSVNPVTFMQLGGNWQALTWQYAVSGALNFSLVLFVWSLLFLVRLQAPLFAQEKQVGFVTTLTVDDPRGQRIVPVAEVAIIRSAGDYVELLHAGRVDLRRGYISDLETQLDPGQFVRIHRSFMINRKFVRDIIRKSKGQFEFDLGEAGTVTSGRSFEDAIVTAFDLG